MSIKDYKKDDSEDSSSKTYVEFQNDESEAQRTAYRLVSRGGQLRTGVEDIDELYAVLTPLLADVLFEEDPTGLMNWLDLDEDDWEEYADEYLTEDE